MSMELMVRVMKAKVGDPLSKLVLLKMADNASDDGRCWPSYQHIADQCEMDRRTAMRHVDKLCACGFLQKELRKGVKGNTSNAYRLTPDNGSAEMLKNLKSAKKLRQMGSVTETPRPSVSESPGLVSQDHPGSVTETQPPGVTESPESVTFLNQSLNQSLNPTHNARGIDAVGPVPGKPLPEYPGQTGMSFSTSSGFGKFPMTSAWMPSADFSLRAAYWGSPIPENLNETDLKAALAGFTDFWIAEGKVFNQVQWEQKFARHLQTVRPIKPRGKNRAALDPKSTSNAAVQRMQAVRAQQLRARGESVEILAGHGGNIFEPLGEQKRIGAVGPMDCSDWEFDQRPDDERL